MTCDAIIIRPHGAGVNYVKGESNSLKVEKANKADKPEVQPVVYGYGPWPGYYVLPLYALLALSLAWI
ncbi:hypothetical protein [Mycobacteroides abscessus]|uniref:hypothetical protein n=1 Tax=Mycobacteroides abscessus TaxID=36809 RepID=UPI00130015F5